MKPPVQPVERRALVGVNLNNPPLAVAHALLPKQSEDSDYRVCCPACEVGTLLVRRNQKTIRLERGDMCTLCGQRVVYTDAEIAGEPLHASGSEYA